MNQSPTVSKIAAALVKAQAAIGSAKKNSVNPFLKNKYADLASVIVACKEHLNENKISVIQSVGRDELGEYVETMLLHESGEFITDRMKLMPSAKPQDQGSALTYARRYALQSMVLIPAEDDDGNAASKVNAPKTTWVAHPQKVDAPDTAQTEEAPESGVKMAGKAQKDWIRTARDKGSIQITDEEIEALTFSDAVAKIGEIRKGLGK